MEKVLITNLPQKPHTHTHDSLEFYFALLARISLAYSVLKCFVIVFFMVANQISLPQLTATDQHHPNQ